MKNAVQDLLLLNAVDGLSGVRLKRLLEHFGSARAVLEAAPTELQAVAGIGPVMAGRIGGMARTFDPSRELKTAASHGIQVLTWADDAFPPLLRDIYDPPPVLYVRGTLRDQDRCAVAIVGSRRATLYGRATARRFAGQLASRGATIVSGLARGIDTAAHEGAAEAGGRTIAVLGCGLLGLDMKRQWVDVDRIAASGAAVSEFPLGMPPLAGNFPRRNRIISGLSLAVLVVEAAQRSGALITADCALEQGREVFAVPGRVDSDVARGTNHLIRQGAALVQSAEELIEGLKDAGRWPFDLDRTDAAGPSDGVDGAAEVPGGGSHDVAPDDGAVPAGGSAPADGVAQTPLPESLQMLYDHVTESPSHVDALSRGAGLDAGRASALLLQLQLRGVVEDVGGKRFRRVVKKSS